MMTARSLRSGMQSLCGAPTLSDHDDDHHHQTQGMAKSAMGTALGFGSFIIKRELPANGVTALESVCAIDQEATLKENAAYVAWQTGCV